MQMGFGCRRFFRPCFFKTSVFFAIALLAGGLRYIHDFTLQVTEMAGILRKSKNAAKQYGREFSHLVNVGMVQAFSGLFCY